MTGIGVIIVAGGSGTRMGNVVPKQFMDLCGKPILAHTLEAFINNIPSANIIVALPENEIGRWEKICTEYGLTGTHTCCAGGENRFYSVRNALSRLPECEIVLVHDGVRPLVSGKTISGVVSMAQRKGTAVPVIKPVDSFRLLDENGNSSHFDREKLRAVQTPQGFRYDILKKAYELPFDKNFTDDASVVEASGVKIELSEGDYENIKITSPADMAIAETFLHTGNKKE